MTSVLFVGLRARVRAAGLLFSLVAASVPCGGASADPGSLPAFPGAEGHGALARGGRGGAIVFVTNLNDDGPGSLREAAEAAGPRTVLFRVAGVIDLQSRIIIRDPYITIAGETSPGGICLKDFGLSVLNTHDVIIRGLAIRVGCDGSVQNKDGLALGGSSDVIVDRCSVSWAIDENVSIESCHNVTIQNCIVSYGLGGNGQGTCHSSGGEHSCGLLIRGGAGGGSISVLRNVFAHNGRRNPEIYVTGDAAVLVDFRNNTVFNWNRTDLNHGYHAADVFVSRLDGDPLAQLNMVRNCFIYGDDSDSERPAIRTRLWDYDNQSTGLEIYLSGDRFLRNGSLQADDGSFVLTELEIGGDSDIVIPCDDTCRVSTPFDEGPFVTTLGVGDAVANAMRVAGAGGVIGRARDSVDARVIWNVALGHGRLIDLQDEILEDHDGDGTLDWPLYEQTSLAMDADLNGIPDAWELAHRLIPGFDGGQRLNPVGYTWLEVYLNSLILQ